ncbi:ADP-ribosyl cyclase/cyclic ADP-ribose hydrolase 2 [Balaenoptera acutorostrata]|uniref:ADP-ribosyl cyclase/cyclic ADP-ribose hydrolase n=1 Tax=Balaenoptera acutorostrata TaxID=9767 RepID=A0A383YX05_BALAC|nr:ADP-ribosyl cyclase/cyclic ADP-ribose hydrolase 2 [Balaenoptera acutorostrata]
MASSQEAIGKNLAQRQLGEPPQRDGRRRVREAPPKCLRWKPGGARSRRPLPALLLFVLLPPAAGAAGAADARWSGQGTIPHLQSIFLGRCAEYIAVLSPELRDKNCTAIWEAFKLVLDKDPCSVLPSDYDLFINLSRHSIPRDKSLFWENNHLLVTSYAENGRRFMPLCNVLYGMVGDFLSWCRQKNASGLDYQSCPTSEDCENNPVDSYWKSASIQYAKDSSGVIYVMLNGSEPTGAYPVKGFFADFEIPHLQKDKITRLEIWVMHEIGGSNVESCGEGSVKILEERLQKMGFQYSCINDYKPVKLLQCVQHSTHPDCALNSAATSTQREALSLYAEQSASFVFPLLVALASVAQM